MAVNSSGLWPAVGCGVSGELRVSHIRSLRPNRLRKDDGVWEWDRFVVLYIAQSALAGWRWG